MRNIDISEYAEALNFLGEYSKQAKSKPGHRQ